jgi:cytochrome c551/c552
MQSFDRILFIPTVSYLTLMKSVIYFLSAIIFLYGGIISGSSLMSVIFNIMAHRRKEPVLLKFSESLARLGAPDRSSALIMGLLPLLTISCAYGIILYSSSFLTPLFIMISAIIFSGAIIMLNGYVRSFKSRDRQFPLHMACGVAGVLLLFAAYFTFTNATLLMVHLVDDAHHPFSLIDFLVSSLYFIALAFTATGGGILFFILSLHSSETDRDPSYKELVSTTGIRITASALIAQFLLGMLAIIRLPHPAPIVDNFVPQALIALSVISLLIVLYRRNSGFEVYSALGIVLIFLMGARAFDVNREEALKTHTGHLITLAGEEEAKRVARQSEKPVYNGAEISRNSCASCHTYDKAVTGPPFKEVLPHYKGKPENLESFIDNPKRVNRNYPPMPRPPLNSYEIGAVAHYLLTDYLREHKENKQ